MLTTDRIADLVAASKALETAHARILPLTSLPHHAELLAGIVASRTAVSYEIELLWLEVLAAAWAAQDGVAA